MLMVVAVLASIGLSYLSDNDPERGGALSSLHVQKSDGTSLCRLWLDQGGPRLDSYRGWDRSS